MTTTNIEAHKEDILNKLREAGQNGMNKTRLNVASKAPKLRIEAFKTLEKEDKIANLGSKTRPRYVVRNFFRPLELAYEIIENHILSKQTSENMKLASRSELEKLLPVGAIRQRRDEALKLLVDEKKLLKVRHGRGTYFLHASPVLEFLEFIQVSPGKDENVLFDEDIPIFELTREQVLAAYETVRQRIGFSNVEIYEIQQELGFPMEQLKTFLLEESQEGRAILSFGDWSLASEDIRSGAVYIDDKPHLLVRFKS